MAVITIAREFGSRGDEIAQRVCDKLGYQFFTKELMTRVAQEQGISEAEVIDFSEDSYGGRSFLAALFRRPAVVATTTVHTTSASGGEERVTQEVDEGTAVEFLAATVRALQKRGRVVVVGRGSHAILQGQPGVLHVRIVAQLENRVQEVIQRAGLTHEGAVALIGERDRAATEYVRRFHRVDWVDPTLYHLTLNSSLLGEAAAVELIVAVARRMDEQMGDRPPASSP
jgi:cytidylate kinase